MPTPNRLLFGAGAAGLIVLAVLLALLLPDALPLALIFGGAGVIYLAIAFLGLDPRKINVAGQSAEFQQRAFRAAVFRGEGQMTAPPATFEGHGTTHPVGKSLTLRWRVEEPTERTPEKYEQLAMFARTPEEFGEIVEEAIRARDERARG